MGYFFEETVFERHDGKCTISVVHKAFDDNPDQFVYSIKAEVNGKLHRGCSRGRSAAPPGAWVTLRRQICMNEYRFMQEDGQIKVHPHEAAYQPYGGWMRAFKNVSDRQKIVLRMFWDESDETPEKPELESANVPL